MSHTILSVKHLMKCYVAIIVLRILILICIINPLKATRK